MKASDRLLQQAMRADTGLYPEPGWSNEFARDYLSLTHPITPLSNRELETAFKDTRVLRLLLASAIAKSEGQ